MSIADKAIEWAVGIASDSSHGYDQTYRWGPNYDCSSLVITAYEVAGAGVKSAGATYTGNMKKVFLAKGFKDVTGSINKNTGAGLQAGDILLHERNHTAMYIGAGKIVQASGNERGGITGGQTGDQTGGEIHVRTYYNYPWDCVLRLSEYVAKADEVTSVFYTVQPGEGFWIIAEKTLGDPGRWRELAKYNGLSEGHTLHPGDVLIIPGVEQYVNPQESEDVLCSVTLPLLRKGASGMAVRTLQTILVMRGVSVPVNGEFGEQTDAAVRKFQTASKLLADGEVGSDTWAALIST